MQMMRSALIAAVVISCAASGCGSSSTNADTGSQADGAANNSDGGRTSASGGTGGGDAQGGTDAGSNGHAIQTVFLILMENHNWLDFKGSADAPYINNTLLAMGGHAEEYHGNLVHP